MTLLHEPLRFEPFLKPVVWGGRKLGEVLHKRLPSAENYGESWEISAHPAGLTRVAEGPFTGIDLAALMRERRDELLGAVGERHAVFPWLIKFLDARDLLSLQVHPSDHNAAMLAPGERGKTEAWFVLAADPGSRIWSGLKPGVAPEAFRTALEEGRAAECLHSFEPRAGQCVFIPAGTVHAVGGGVLMAEIQQTSDATFRLFDWNRVDERGKSRQLHVSEGLAAIDWTREPARPITVPNFPGPGAGQWHVCERRLLLADCPFFRLHYRESDRPLSLEPEGRLRALIVAAGKGRFSSGGELSMGQAWLVPATCRGLTVVPEPGIAFLEAVLP